MTIYTLMPLHESLGLAVIGVDLSQPLDSETSENLSRLLARHLVLVFPDQSLTPDQYLNAATAFGPPMRQHYSQHHMPDYPDIGLVWHQNGQQPAETWHTDHTNHERPPAATMLYGVEIPSSGGGTSIADMRAAYWSLEEEERRELEGLRTVNSLDPERSRYAAGGSRQVRCPSGAPDGADASGQPRAGNLFPPNQDRIHRRHDARGKQRVPLRSC